MEEHADTPLCNTTTEKNQRQWIDERNLMFVAIANPMIDMV